MGSRYFVYDNKKYAFNLDKIKKFCLVSDKEVTKESEVLENYEMGDETPTLTNKTSRTLKSTGNPQNDTIAYDLIKLFITTLLDNETPIFEVEDIPEDEDDDYFKGILTFGSAISLNTMLEAGFIYEIIDE